MLLPPPPRPTGLVVVASRHLLKHRLIATGLPELHIRDHNWLKRIPLLLLCLVQEMGYESEEELRTTAEGNCSAQKTEDKVRGSCNSTLEAKRIVQDSGFADLERLLAAQKRRQA